MKTLIVAALVAGFAVAASAQTPAPQTETAPVAAPAKAEKPAAKPAKKGKGKKKGKKAVEAPKAQ